MDWFVILGPLLVFGIVALLGFAGCGFEGRVGPVSPRAVTLRIRVPTTINVLRAGFRLDAPSKPEEAVQAGPVTPDAGFNVYEHHLSEPEMGTWRVVAAVRAGAAGSPEDAEATQDLVFPADYADWVAVFQASDDPPEGPLRVEFISFEQQV